MSKSRSNLPGYIFDPTTEKYYKDDAHGRKIVEENARKAQMKQTKIKTKKSSSTKNTNVITLLTQREQGSKTNSRELVFKHFMKVVISNLKCMGWDFVHEDDDQELGSFLIAGSRAMYATYHSATTSLTVIRKISYRGLTYDCFARDYPTLLENCISHICEGVCANDELLAISSSLAGKGTIHICKQRPMQELHFSTRIFVSPFWCLASNSFRSLYACGGQSCIKILGSHEGIMKAPCRITALQFTSNGQKLFFGTHNGHIGVFDIKTFVGKYQPYKMKRVDTFAINALVVWTHDNTLICSTMGSRLLMVNAHTLEPLIEFRGHVSLLKHSTLSLCEDNNLICATGSDNVTRLWSFYDPQPLVELKSLSGKTAHGVLRHEKDYCVLYRLEDEKIFIYNVFGKNA